MQLHGASDLGQRCLKMRRSAVVAFLWVPTKYICHIACQPVRQEFMENECEALPGVAYPGVRDNRSTLNTKTGYDDE